MTFGLQAFPFHCRFTEGALNEALWMCAAAFAREASMRVVKSEPLRQAEMSERWTPFSLNIITPVGIPCFGFDWDVRGLEIGLGNYHLLLDSDLAESVVILDPAEKSGILGREVGRQLLVREIPLRLGGETPC